MSRLGHARIAALPAALIVSGFCATALGQDTPSTTPPAVSAPAMPAAAPPAPPTAPVSGEQAPPAVPPASDVGSAISPTSTEGDIGPRRAVSAHEPLLDAETSRLTWPNVPLMATGATVFAISYAPAIVGAALSDRGDDKLFIPVAGPWLTLAQGPDEKASYKALLIADGAVQGLGALMLVSSFFIPEKTTKSWYLIGSNDLRVAPTAGRGSYGMAAAGRF